MKTLTFILIACAAIVTAGGQNSDVPCGSRELHEWLMRSNLQYRNDFLERESEIHAKISERESQRKRFVVYTVPVVVHVVHLGEPLGTGTNIPDSNIVAAINGLNDRFRNVMGSSVDIELEFCLATRDPGGNATTGINRVNGSGIPDYSDYGIESGDCGIGAVESSVKDLSKWPVSDYYNIWAVSDICDGQWGGYAYFPFGGDYDGTVIVSSWMRYNSTLLTHEVGHGFNLYHTFEGDGDDAYCPDDIDCNFDGDQICDTPPHKKSDCGSSNPCSTLGIWDNSRYNYMSYCSGLDRFTQNQKDRMIAALLVQPRLSLLSSDGCLAPANITISGTIKTETQVKIPGATMTYTGTNSGSQFINNGDYTLNIGQPGNYSVTPSKANDIISNNGNTTLDILLVRRHILNTSLLGSPYKIIAADVNASSSVTTADILLIRSVILQTNTTFPNGNLWAFVPHDYVFSNMQNPFPFPASRAYTNLNSPETGEDFIGIKLGDVNNDWDQNVAKTSSAGEVRFMIDDQDAVTGEDITVSVNVKDFTGIAGYQFTISWDPDVITLLEVNNGELTGFYGMNRKNDGYLTTSWDDEAAHAVTVADDKTVFGLKFRVIGATGSLSPIAIGSNLTTSEAYNRNLDLLNIVPTNGMVKVGDDVNRFHPSQRWNLSVVPNPFTNTATIIFTLPQDEMVTLSLYDILGREIKQVKATCQAGEHRVEWNGDDEHGNLLSKGLYHVRLVAGKYTGGVKVVLVK